MYLPSSSGVARATVYDSEFSSGLLDGLPLTLLTFDAEAFDKRVLLTWRTEAEVNTDKFIVERTPDGVNFAPIGEVDAAGQSAAGEVTAYALADESPLPGTSYYRLRMQDFDGSFEYSELREVRFDRAGGSSVAISIFPNPTSGLTTVRVHTAKVSGQVGLRIYDVLGRTVVEHRLVGPLSTFDIDLSTYPVGIYHCEISIGGAYSEVHRIVRQ